MFATKHISNWIIVHIIIVQLSYVHLDTSLNSNFIQTSILPDNETETKILWNNLTAIQTSIAGFTLQQISTGHHLLQLWSVGDQLSDCDYDEDEATVRGFLREFKENLTINSNGSINSNLKNEKVVLESISKDLPEKFKSLSQFGLLEEKCRQLHQQIRYKYSSIHNKRWKRSEFLVFPGTNWCGVSNKSRSFKELGMNAGTDRCCRDHDHCKHTVLPFTWKYRLFNYNLYTTSNCECDERFRSCLKLSGSGTSNLVGKLFFNIIQTKCFTFKFEKLCVKRSWWGRCLKMRRKRRAYFRDSMSF